MSKKYRWLALVGFLASLQVLFGSVSPLPAQALPAQALPAQALPAQALPSQSLPGILSFAGYVGNPSKAATKTSVSFVVPALTCKHVSQPESISETLALQGVPGAVGAFVNIACEDQAASYTASWFAFGFEHRSFRGGGGAGGGEFTMTIAAGDTIVETVSASQSGSAVTVADSTSSVTDSTKKHSLPGVSAVTSYVGMGCPGTGDSCTSIPKFGTVDFSAATVNSKPIGSSTPDEFQLKDVTTSALSSSGDSFSETYA